MKINSPLFIILLLLNSASVFAAGSLTVEIKNNDHTSTGTIKFSIVTGTVPPDQYMEIIYSTGSLDNVFSFISIYTNNTSADTGYQKGGLIDGKARIPLLWSVYNATQSIQEINTTEWAWVKDKSDDDDPGTDDIDESWRHAFIFGYVDIYSEGFLADYPNREAAISPIYVYLGGYFGQNPAAGDYLTTIIFDLYHSDSPKDAEPPFIKHTPIEEINMLGNKIVIQATITDNVHVTKATLHYRVKGTTNSYKEVSFKLSQDTNLDYFGSAEIPSHEVTLDGIEYYITAEDGWNISCYSRDRWTASLPTDVVPLEIKVNQKVTVAIGENGGMIILLDGNPEDGNVKLSISKGALTKKTDITIIQRNVNAPVIPEGNGAATSRNPVAIYEFNPSGLRFNRSVDMKLLYFDLDDDGIVDGTEYKEENLGIFRWDGFEWRLLGSKVDTAQNIVRTKISHFSLYAIFPVRPLTADDYRPAERIITPASIDDFNDFVTFDALIDGFEIKIFDVTGRLVRTISEHPPEWHGEDDYGNKVESGVYIYQFKALVEEKMKLISGVIAVAK